MRLAVCCLGVTVSLAAAFMLAAGAAGVTMGTPPPSMMVTPTKATLADAASATPTRGEMSPLSGCSGTPRDAYMAVMVSRATLLQCPSDRLWSEQSGDSTGVGGAPASPSKRSGSMAPAGSESGAPPAAGHGELRGEGTTHTTEEHRHIASGERGHGDAGSAVGVGRRSKKAPPGAAGSDASPSSPPKSPDLDDTAATAAAAAEAVESGAGGSSSGNLLAGAPVAGDSPTERMIGEAERRQRTIDMIKEERAGRGADLKKKLEMEEKRLETTKKSPGKAAAAGSPPALVVSSAAASSSLDRDMKETKVAEPRAFVQSRAAPAEAMKPERLMTAARPAARHAPAERAAPSISAAATSAGQAGLRMAFPDPLLRDGSATATATAAPGGNRGVDEPRGGVQPPVSPLPPVPWTAAAAAAETNGREGSDAVCPPRGERMVTWTSPPRLKRRIPEKIFAGWAWVPNPAYPRPDGGAPFDEGIASEAAAREEPAAAERADDATVEAEEGGVAESEAEERLAGEAEAVGGRVDPKLKVKGGDCCVQLC